MVQNLWFIGLKQVYFKVFQFRSTTGYFQVAKITHPFSTSIHVQILVVSCLGQWQLDEGLKLFSQHNKEIVIKPKGEKQTTELQRVVFAPENSQSSLTDGIQV